MSDCDKYRELISCYIDGTISTEDQQQLFQHIETCQECAELLDIYSDISRTLADDTDPPQELLSGVMSGVRNINAKRKHDSRLRLRKRAIWFAAAACAAILILPAANFLLNGAGGSDDAENLTGAVMYDSAQANTKDYSEEAADESLAADGYELNQNAGNGAVSEGDSGSVQQALPTVEEVSQGYYAVVYAQALPAEIQQDDSRLTMEFADGSAGLQITLAELSVLEESGGYEIVYENDESDSALLVYTP